MFCLVKCEVCLTWILLQYTTYFLKNILSGKFAIFSDIMVVLSDMSNVEMWNASIYNFNLELQRQKCLEMSGKYQWLTLTVSQPQCVNRVIAQYWDTGHTATNNRTVSGFHKFITEAATQSGNGFRQLPFSPIDRKLSVCNRNVLSDSKDPQISVDQTSFWYFRVRSMSNRHRYEGLCYLGPLLLMCFKFNFSMDK